ncbi:hypothetical protein J19TS2_06430 [Cohnella xylanilytica]|uniref:Helix-turn-helix domain-containing protein n=2 Tax=Cohnella xylanilytica TaxID=557555 RepID=A0A841U4J6_9BACL|nr:helix-turn-helix domain-containing protein [Cohnella xylanilytica]GIO11088.1 hypothetical protein J19TS2_06430 [Cohnella xylanilytica]
MKMKVIMVDDEILALEHLKSLIDWDTLGYELTGCFTNPKKALSFAIENKPHLLIADIRMPIMDGLELARQSQAAGLSPRIVLLTSHKEFEYAKEAMKLGISDYWVKHETDAPTLARELERLRKELLDASEVRAAVRKQLLGELLAGRTLTPDQWRTIAGDRANAETLRLLAVRKDKPLAVIPEAAAFGGGAAPLEPGPPEEAEDEDDCLAPVASLVAGDAVCVLLAMRGTRSELRARERLHAVADRLRAAFERLNGGRASVAVSSPVRDWRKLPEAYAEASRLLERSAFGRYGGVLFQDDETAPAAPQPDGRGPDAEPHLAALDEAVRRRDQAAAAEAINRLFASLSAAGDLAALTESCRRLVATLNRLGAEGGLPSVAQSWNEGRIDARRWMRPDDVRAWFLERYELALNATGSAAAYSRKVRQALDYMRERYAEEVTSDAIAEHIGISKDHLRHLFKEETGETVLDALTRIRIDEAKRLLRDGSLKIYEIAERVGYRNGQYFSQVFRKATGMNPLEYAERRE